MVAPNDSISSSKLLSWEFTFKYVVILFGITAAIGFVASGIATYIIATGGASSYASIFLSAQNILVPITIFICFIWLAGSTDRPIVRSVSVFLWTIGISFIVNVLIGGQPRSVFWSSTGVVFAIALVGTAFGGLFAKQPVRE